MKKIFLTFSLSLLILSGCTKDGKNGKSYISIDWEYVDSEYKVSAYTDNNPDTPTGAEIVAGTYYLSEPGTYSYTYQSEDYNYYYDHSGTYTLDFNVGAKKTLFKDGADGEDTYFDLYLTVYKKKSQPLTNGFFAPETRKDTLFFKRGYIAIDETIEIRSKK